MAISDQSPVLPSGAQWSRTGTDLETPAGTCGQDAGAEPAEVRGDFESDTSSSTHCFSMEEVDEAGSGDVSPDRDGAEDPDETDLSGASFDADYEGEAEAEAGAGAEAEAGAQEPAEWLDPLLDAAPVLSAEQPNEAAWSTNQPATGRQIEDIPRPRPQTVAVPVGIWVGGQWIEDRRGRPPAIGSAGVARRTTFTRRCEYHGFCDPSDPLGCGGELCGKKPHGRIE